MGRKTAAKKENDERWDALLARALASLDERGEESLARRRVSAAKKIARDKARGVRLEIDLDGVKRALVAYYEGCVGLTEFKRFVEVFSDSGVLMSDFFDGIVISPELNAVYEYVQRVRDSVTKADAMDSGREAQKSQRRLVTEEGCRLNQRAVEVSLRATMKDVYGEGGGGGDEGSGRPQVVYNLPNLTVNMITAPVGLLGAAKHQEEAIDAEEVSHGP